MRIFNCGAARIARSLVAVLLLTFIQSVALPVLTSVTTPQATAVDANDFPSGLGTVYQYVAESYTSGATTWPEARGGSAATISSSALKVSNVANTLGASKAVVAVQGSYQTSITFPSNIAYGNATNPNDYTFFHVARYAPQQPGLTNADYCDTIGDGVVNNAAKKNRIFSSSGGNWLSGFWACAAGVSHHYGWLTQYNNSINELSGSNGNNWLLSADCGYVSSSSSACNGRYRAFGVDRTTTQSTSVFGHSVVVNSGQFPAEVSDFQIAEVISFPTILSVENIIKVETYLARKYGINLSSSSATKLSVLRTSVGTNLYEQFATQPQIVIQDANGLTVTTDNSTIVTATVTGVNGRIIGTATADAVQGVATFENLGVDGIPNNSYTITYSSNTGLAPASETRTFTRGGSSETDTALSLNGSNQYAEVTDGGTSPLDLNGTFTLSAWVKPNDGCSGNGTVLTKRSYMMYCSGGYWYYMVLTDGMNGAGVSTGIPVAANEWHHLAFTKSSASGNLLVYYDGVLYKTIATGVTTIAANNQPFSIGRYGTGMYFNGLIDEVRVFNTQRSQSQIAVDLGLYGDVFDAGLVAYYDFNEGTGTTIYNREAYLSSAYDLTIYNSATFVDVKNVDTTTLAAYTIVKFTRTYITALGGWKVPANVSRATVATVAGGGGGGARHGGGGGAGGVAYAATLPLSSGGVYKVSVGFGGIGYGQLGNNPYSGANGSTATQNDNGPGTSGGNSIFGLAGSSESVTAIGGGGSGLAGGSSGGTNSGSSYTTVAEKTQYSTSYFVGYGNKGGQGYNGTQCGTDWCGGGGGGAGGVGGTPSIEVGNSYPGDGGIGWRSNISGTLTYYAGGGGGAGKDATSASIGGLGGGGAGGNGTQGTHATQNTGGGGGGGGFSGGTNYRGGNGGSGIIFVRWITAAKPIFTQPQSDTTTAGLTDTITVSANPLNPLTRNYQWQVSTDTGTTWVNASTGSGITSNTYTTPILETNTSGARYQYRVVVTDSDTAGLFIIDTSVAIFIVINPRITYTGSYTTQKYGSTHQDTFTVLNGTGNKTFTYSPNNRSGITWSSPLANTAVLTIGTTLFVGTYFETITATDTKGAQTSLGISIIISKADTITVTAIARSETYTGSTLSFTPTFTVTGLKNSDTVTAASMSWRYNGVENSGTLYALQTTKPINAGNYDITPVAPSSLTDSYTAVTVVTANLSINRATRTISITPPASPLKFGETKTVSATPSAGSGDGIITYATSTADSCTVSSTLVQAIKSSGNCAFTATISRGNNYETATSTSGTTSLTKADTITVTVDPIAPLTYTGAQIGITPSVSVNGLKLSNSVGATPATIKYASSGGGAGTCASGGACAVGDTGPGGGIVFYDAGSQQSWGRYLEIAKSGWSGSAGETTAKWCSTALNATALNVIADGIGQGLINSTSIANSCGEGAAFLARAYNGGGKSNWYLPTAAEFVLMYTNRNVIDLSTNTLIWLSQEANDANMNWVARVGALSSSGIGGNNKIDILSFRPIRAFAAGDTSQNFVLTKPTDADTYTVRASSLTLSVGSLTDYQGVTYVDATMRINRAQQAQLFLAEYGAIFGTPFKVIVFGGSGTGAAKVTTTSGTATGCTISGDTLTSTSIGSCSVTAVKAQDKNYETATVTIGVYFLDFVIQQPAPPAMTGPGIALSGITSVTLDPNQAPTITGISVSSGRAGDTVTITGAGFTASALQSVKFWRNVLASVQGTPTNTQIVVLVPAGATTGKILVITANGSAVTEGSFTVLP